ncbi:tubulin-folding cofactor B isoform X1 [Prionailurus iriomotensis]
MDWLGREQGEGLISQKRRRRLRSRCEATNPAADPGTSGEMEVTGLSAPTVTVFISSSLNSFRSEKRYSRSLTIAEFKCKLELVVGSPASCMELELYGADDKFYSKLDQEDALLGSYPVDDGCRIHTNPVDSTYKICLESTLVSPTTPALAQPPSSLSWTPQQPVPGPPQSATHLQPEGACDALNQVIDHSGARLGEYEDVSKVEKYQISQEAYDQRQDSVRSFLKRSKLGRYNEEERAQQEAEATQRLNEEKTQASAISVGSRCEVRAPGQPPRRGTVMYVGLTDFKRGYWIGVRYDEPLGKNDGSVNGKRYFECQAKYGAFVKPSVVTVGDFPEEDYGLDEM